VRDGKGDKFQRFRLARLRPSGWERPYTPFKEKRAPLVGLSLA
jgi:hypothetical protein